MTRCIDAGRGVIRQRGVFDGSVNGRPLKRSHSARTEYYFADVVSPDEQYLQLIAVMTKENFSSNDVQ